MVQIIRDNARRLERMVHDVLELSRRDRVQPEPIRVRQYLLTFIEEFARNEGQIPGDSFSVEAAHDVTVEFDRTHLNQVLWNLLHNAWRHCRRLAGSVRIAASRRANRVELHVIDDGEGVPQALQAQLFEPFFTTFASGTGLGLYIARELCAANGARLDYLDRGSGADFRILWQEP
jgi:two-component system sensor histidine kinase PilS (NtrC family)